MNYLFGVLGILIGLVVIGLLYFFTMRLYFYVRKKYSDSKFFVEFAFMFFAFLLGIVVKIAIEWEVSPERNILGSVANFFFTFHSALGSIGFGNLPHGLDAGVSNLLIALYYGTAIYIGLIFVSVISARVSYEFYSYLRLLRKEKADIYVFTALTEESITLAESIKTECEKNGKTPLIVFGGSALDPFDRKDALCRRVMSNDFCYWSYSADKKGSIAKILHLNNENKEEISRKFMIFAFDSEDHIPEEEENLNVVINDLNERKLNPDRLFIEYVVLTKRKINYQAYQSVVESTQYVLLPNGEKSYVNGSKKNLEDAASNLIDEIIKSGDKKDVRICAVGVGHNGGIFVDSAFDKLTQLWEAKKNKIKEKEEEKKKNAAGAVTEQSAEEAAAKEAAEKEKAAKEAAKASGCADDENESTEEKKEEIDPKKLPIQKDTLCIVEVFDKESRYKELESEDEVKKRSLYRTKLSSQQIREELRGEWNDEGYPCIAYNYQQADRDEGKPASLMKACILGEKETPADLITVALGDNEETIKRVNTICEWIVDAPAMDKPRYLVFSHREPLQKGWLKIAKKRKGVKIGKTKIGDKEYMAVIKDGAVRLVIVPAHYASLIASLTLFNEAYEVGRNAVRRIMDDGLIDTLNKEENRGVSAWALGFGGTGEAITNELFVQTPGILSATETVNGKEVEVKYSRPYAVNVFDPKMTEAGEVFRAEHDKQEKGGYTIFSKEKIKGENGSETKIISWKELLEKAKTQSMNASEMPAPVYAFHTFRDDDAELYRMKEDILGEIAAAPDVITITTGDDYRNITYANTIGQWIVNQKATKGSTHNYYLVVGIFDKNNNYLLSTFGSFLNEERKEIVADNLRIIIVNNLEDVYSFSRYMERRNSAIQKHNTYERLTNSKRKVWSTINELCKTLKKEKSGFDVKGESSFDVKEESGFIEKGKEFERKLTELTEKYCNNYNLPAVSVPDGNGRHCKEVETAVVTRINALFEKERQESLFDKNTILNYENSSLWDKASSQSVVSAEEFYRAYFKKQIRKVICEHLLSVKPIGADSKKTLAQSMKELLEDMITVEHDRWVRHHFSDGWTFAEKNKPKRLHNCLIPYPILKEKKNDTLGYDFANVMWALCGIMPMEIPQEESNSNKA